MLIHYLVTIWVGISSDKAGFYLALLCYMDVIQTEAVELFFYNCLVY